MDMEQLYSYVPRELVTFVLVTLFSLLIGLSQRRISLKREGETTLFGTDRTFTSVSYTHLDVYKRQGILQVARRHYASPGGISQSTCFTHFLEDDRVHAPSEVFII